MNTGSSGFSLPGLTGIGGRGDGTGVPVGGTVGVGVGVETPVTAWQAMIERIMDVIIINIRNFVPILCSFLVHISNL
jgi:hypothetical protein